MLLALLSACLVDGVPDNVAQPSDSVAGPTDEHDTAGPWTGLDAGEMATCALDLDGGLACWGESAVTESPAALFDDVAVGAGWACGHSSDGTLDCWGEQDLIPTGITSAQVSLVAAGTDMLCALDEFTRASCWGCEGDNCDEAGSVFVDLAVTDDGACGARESGEFACWGEVHGEPPEAMIRPRSFDGGAAHYCARWHDGEVACWGDDSLGQTDAPDLAFTDVTTGAFHSCGLLEDGGVACWGDNSHGESDPPTEHSFSNLSAGNGFTCGITTGDEVVCWGNEDHGVGVSGR